MIPIDNLELHITHQCNFSCEGCSHFANMNLSGMIPIEEAELWIKSWSKRIQPSTFSILGGEPTLHPDLSKFLLISRRYWKVSRLRLVTNGSFLHNHPDLPKVLTQISNTCLYISIHHDSQEYKLAMEPIIDLVNRWHKDYAIDVQYYESYKYWTRRYIEINGIIFPYKDNDPQKSWENCTSKYYFQLHKGKIWKCAPLTFLPLVKNKYIKDWNKYLKYIPLDISCTDNELVSFVNKESEDFCSMCPKNPPKFMPPLPFIKKSS